MSVIMIPYGYKFEKDRLFRKLFCETSIPYFNSAEVDRYFSDLVNLNAISDEAANSRLGDADEAGAWQWNVNQHDHQVLVSESAGMDFIYTSDTLNLLEADFATYIRKEASRTPRRLALHHDVPDIQSLLQYVDLLQTRSLAVSGAVSRSVPLHRFRNLVVLDVEGWKNFGDAELFRICKAKMFFLVYLSITNTGVSKFPPEIKELCSLQVLDASYTQVTELHLGDFEETRLHRLDLRGTPIRKLTIPKQTLELQEWLSPQKQHQYCHMTYGISSGYAY
nr:unnamed protein product [Digitaria exilis]